MLLENWAARWGVPAAAITELKDTLGAIESPVVKVGESESAVQSRLRLEIGRVNGRLWRNNVGAVYTDTGAFLRYGLCNESKAINDQLKSSDLIGIKPVLVQPYHVGSTIGQFVARECKRSNWRYSATPREKAQLNYLMLVHSLGGDASFAVGTGTLA